MDYKSWREALPKDRDTLELLTLMVGDITPEYDSKLQELCLVLSKTSWSTLSMRGNKKIIIFHCFCRYSSVSVRQCKQVCEGEFRTEYCNGIWFCRRTHHCSKTESDLNTVLTCFSPISKDKNLLMPDDKTEIDYSDCY